mmetsp:Transcript_2186/g.3158  ORF Transcript_2186/g.3158 Transcript_2186/m.3158 type:complete len:951 (-) Transcript_2186:204-3056(-)
MMILLFGILLVPDISVQAADPTFCVQNRTVEYDCNCYRCCHKCGCHVNGNPFKHCNGCGDCWCSPACRCCGHDCCDTCCDKCNRIECANLVTYKVHGVQPSSGPVTGGTVVRVLGGVFSNIGGLKCKFGSTVVDGEMISQTEVRCIAPSVTPETRSVSMEISLDDGENWTENNVTFLYHNCPGDGVCNSNGVCHPDSSCTCNKGYFGDGCQNECPGGQANPCTGRTDSGTCNDEGNCTCIHGYFGDSCEFECPNGAEKPCDNHGRCLPTGQCQCDEGWVGTNCTQPGTCQGNQCQCFQGYWGPQCSEECVGGHTLNCRSSQAQGTCGPDGKCYCSRGYFGTTCENECPGGATNPCNGRGEQDTCSSNGVCHCHEGYFGTACEHECPGGALNPCTGHGKCSTVDGHCMCEDGWYGADCSMECPGGHLNPCTRRGTCDQDSGSCGCNSTLFYGAACESICECDGRGVCDINGTCTCFHGYFGGKCQFECPGGESTPCSNAPNQPIHGICIPGLPPTCACIPGWYGEACESECPGGYATPCSNHGVCTDQGTCNCNPFRDGVACENALCPYNCNGHGNCTRGDCACEEGYELPYCFPASGGDVGPNVSIVHGVISFETTKIYVEEYVEEVVLSVKRDQGKLGDVSATVVFRDSSAIKGLDYWGLNGQSLYWTDGDDSPRNVSLIIIQDAIPESDEEFEILLSPITGGAIPGNSSVLVVIKGNDVGNSTTRVAVEIKFRLATSIDDLPEGSRARVEFENGFGDNIARVLQTDPSRVRVELLGADQISTLIQILLLPAQDKDKSATDSNADVQILTANLINFAKNGTSQLYQLQYTKSIDITYPPEVIQTTAPPKSSDDDKDKDLSAGAIAGIVIGGLVFIILVIAGFCYWKRLQITEWCLWKLGNFRFDTLRKRRASDSNESKAGSMDEFAGNDSVIGDTGNQQFDAMPVPEDF